MRSMIAATALSQSVVSRIWRAFGLKPHLVQTYKLSTDPQFIEKVREVVGLYLDPPDRALVLCVDEKSQIQALDRTAPCLPILSTKPAWMAHDYVRNGTTSLFAAFETSSGSVIAQHYRRHRHQEFLRFLKLIDDAVPKGLVPLENRISALTWAFPVSGGSLVLVDQTAQYRFSADLPRARVGCGGAGAGVTVRDALADALMGPGPGTRPGSLAGAPGSGSGSGPGARGAGCR
jgi:hypothetical protein